jgi:hypothetical protein
MDRGPILLKWFTVNGLIVHRQDIIILTLEHPLGGRHEHAPANWKVLVEEKGGEALALQSHRLVGLVEDRKVEAMPC